ncbi:MAG: CHASE2 domain-containing protein [Nitrospinaceae bacterium]
MKRSWINSFTVALFLTLLSIYIYFLDFRLFQLLELKTYDLKITSRENRQPSGNVVIVAIDEKSLKEQGRWPWPRTKLALLVDRLTAAGAAVIGIDIFFPEKDSYLPMDQVKQELGEIPEKRMTKEQWAAWLDTVGNSDEQFARALEKSKRSVLSYFVYGSKEQGGGFAEILDSKHLDLLDFSQYSVVQRFDDPAHPASVYSIYSVGMSLPILMEAADSAGFVSFLPEMDGVIRRIPLVVEYNENFFPPLSLQVLQQTTGLPLNLTLAPFGVDRILLGDAVIPTSEKGDLLINYYGPAQTFPYLAATDVLEGRIDAGRLQNKIVLIGASGAGTFDLRTTPYGPLYPGVETHASVIDNILQQDYIVRPPWIGMLDMAVILVSGLLMGAAGIFFRAMASAVLLGLGVTGYILADFIFFSQKGLWINTVFPVFTQFFVYTGTTLYRFVFEERQKRFIKQAFSQYLAPSVVNLVVANPELLKLGGERKELTAFFTDLEGFTTISEQLTPERLVELLNNYLTEMSDIMLNHEGTIDKYEGDAIAAFFGAPVFYEDHAWRACITALEMQSRLAELRAQWKKDGWPELYMRIGINTGPMVVGNMGSKDRMDYTMMGDSVNLAARLEGANKYYKTYTMISGMTLAHVKDRVEVRELDTIRVVGKSEPAPIFELLGKKGELDETLAKIVPIYDEGLGHYKNQDWDAALDCFGKALKHDKEDGPLLTYFERCLHFKSSPPAKDWDGVFILTSK